MGGRHYGRRVHQMRGFVAATPKRLRRQVWSIGLDEQSVERDCSGGCTQQLLAPKRDDPRERDVHPEVDEGLDLRGVTGVAVHHATSPWHALKHLLDLVEGVARMNDQRQVDLNGERALVRKRSLLAIPRLELVVVVEAGLADRAHVGVSRQPAKLSLGLTVPSLALVRMHADAGDPALESIRELDGAPAGSQVGANNEDRLDTGFAGAGVERVQTVSKGRIRQVRVSVEERTYDASTLGNSALPPGTWCPAVSPNQPPPPHAPGSAGGRPRLARIAVDVRGMAGWI